MAGRTDMPTAKFYLRLFGRFQLTRSQDSEPATTISITSRRGRALIAYLAMHLDEAVPRSRLAELLWEDRTESLARHSLRQVLSELRDEVGEELDGGIEKETVKLTSQYFDVDAINFIRHGRKRTTEDLEAATSLYTGDLTADIEIKTENFDEWISVERRRLHASALEIFDAYVRALTSGGNHKRALSICERLLVLDPTREATHRLLISLEASINGRGSALNRFEQLAADLKRQLGVTPEQATLDLIASLGRSAATDTKNSGAGVSAPPPETNDAMAGQDAGRIMPSARRWGFAGLSAGTVAVLAVFALRAGFPEQSKFFTPYWVTASNSTAGQNGENRGKFVKPNDLAYSIAVIPFVPRSESEQLRRFVSTLEEDVIDNLSHGPRFIVISRLTSMSYRDSKKDAREIGKEIGVDFLLTGNATLDDDNRIVVRAQLTDTQTGIQVWTQRFVHNAGSRYEVFDEIVIGIARQLHVQIMLSEGLRQARLDKLNPSYGDLIQRGFAESLLSFSNHENAEKALSLFEQALAINPNSPSAQVGIATVLTRRIAELRSLNRSGDLQRAEALLLKAIEGRPNASSAHYFLGIVRKLQGRNDDSIAEFKQALKLNPNLANAHAQLGHSLIFLGHAEETEAYVHKAIRLSPRDPTISSWYLFAGQAALFLERHGEAIRWLEQSVESYSGSGRAYIFLAAAYVLDGQDEKAAQAARKATSLLPDFVPKRLRTYGGTDAHPKFLEQRERVIQAIEKALALARS